MKLAFIFIIILFLAGNFYVFQRFWILMPPSNIGRILLVTFAIIVISSLIINFAFGEILPIGVTSFFYKVGTSWLFIVIYFLILALLKDFIRILHITPPGTFTHYTRDNWMGLIFAVSFVSMVMICGYLKYRWKVRVEVPVTVGKTIEKHDSLKIVAISDLHLGYNIGADELTQWIDSINKEKPDIVIIAGDIVDSSVRPLDAHNIASCFKQIKSTYGVYSCLGNHEYISGVKESVRFINEAGIHLLRDSAILIDSSFYIVGRDDKMNPSRKPLKDLVAGLDTSKPVILLDHQPYNLEEVEENGIDLQFSGHTHKGQVWPITWIVDAMYEVPYGYLKKGNTNVYVSSGIGIWGGKFRIGTQSEYVVINMKSE